MKANRIYIAGAVVLLGVATYLFFVDTVQAPSPSSATPQQVAQESLQENSASLSVQGLYAHKKIIISTDDTVLHILQTLDAEDPQLQLTTKEYVGLGSLVVAMHGDKNGTNGNYWQYKINGVMPQIGASAYKLKNGDNVEWYFGKSEL